MPINQRDEIDNFLRQKDSLLVILDACRYDTFKRVNWLKGTLKKATSLGSTTSEWLKNTFPGFYDMVYISTTAFIDSIYRPMIHGNYIPDAHFRGIIDLWKYEYNHEFGTIMPNPVFNAACQYREPGRPTIAHFAQPHVPMIGKTGFTIATWEKLTGEKTNGHFPEIKMIFEKGYGELFKKAYGDNLIAVLKVVEKLAEIWGSDVAITADHGEGFGENGIYGHAEGIRTPELIEVPFFRVGEE